MTWRLFSPVLVLCAWTSLGVAQLPNGWRQHDIDRPLPKVITPGDGNLKVTPPSDATVLFDGTDLSQWRSSDGGPSKWVIVDGVMESVAGSGYVFTRQAYGDCQLHIEWASPADVKGNSQGRGNSGVFLMGKYEVQVLDSFENKTYADGSAASIYGQYPPLVNASRGPGQWQSYDIIFRRPRFGASGELVSSPRVTVLHNGVLVQDSTEPFGPTSWLEPGSFDHHSDKLPLSLQDHGNPVRYRNIWIRPLDESPRTPRTTAYETSIVQLTPAELDRLVGKYDGYDVSREDRTLFVRVGGAKLELIATSPLTFNARYTATTLTFNEGDDDAIESVTRTMGGDTHTANRNSESEN
ncbi:hypothetical protein K227x_38400 [Rubripirellula lacrimiformis]|uniref:3-keto-alpha-glucoside-1,2-lyase/3-keto-2-hydroxy-glucal hydratase domain-containing protein n=1 Tax=Rubripirellula lacrimiformis TaxID=1930273 RepID=A0A517NE96_9BACT|nr:DUF1080 domain-containing protein [Rubripirellula lacrimiformis]QDT05440.1 hypothetical protein K227x_38400 [Rubripirellula lacrimiformis]